MSDISKKIVEEYRNKGKLHPDFLSFPTYDLVQVGYPLPNKGQMVERVFGGTDAQDRLLPSNGEWCRVEDVKKLISINS